MPDYFDKSEKERDRIQRMKRKDQEKYAEEALQRLNEEGRGKQFGRLLEQEFNVLPQDESRR